MLNKKQVEDFLQYAPAALVDCQIVEPDGSIKKTFRGQISSFGAAVSMGSFKCAIAFFSDQGGAAVKRDKLVEAMDYMCHKNRNRRSASTICNEICEITDKSELNKIKNKYLSASLALKMAMNAYHLTGEEENG